jgi:hypothetical protein
MTYMAHLELSMEIRLLLMENVFVFMGSMLQNPASNASPMQVSGIAGLKQRKP